MRFLLHPRTRSRVDLATFAASRRVTERAKCRRTWARHVSRCSGSERQLSRDSVARRCRGQAQDQRGSPRDLCRIGSRRRVRRAGWHAGAGRRRGLEVAGEHRASEWGERVVSTARPTPTRSRSRAKLESRRRVLTMSRYPDASRNGCTESSPPRAKEIREAEDGQTGCTPLGPSGSVRSMRSDGE